MKTYWGNGGTLHTFLTSALDGSELSASRPSRLNPGERAPVLTRQEAGWAPELVWTRWGREKFATPPGIGEMKTKVNSKKHS